MKLYNYFSFLFAIFILHPLSSNAQHSFRYQAVVRNNDGTVLADQDVDVEIAILQPTENAPPVYQETHLTSSNEYGVIHLDVGRGDSLLGNFSEMDWSKESFLKIEMDIVGQNNGPLQSTSLIQAVPKAIYAEQAGQIASSKFGLYVTDFGAVGDGQTDDTDAFVAALDSAAIRGSKVFVPQGIYKTTGTIEIKDGVSLIGEGMGSDPLQTPYNGSLIRYEGDSVAVKITGHSSQLKDLVIRDNSGGQASGGIVLEADGRLLENVYFFGVLVSGFVHGTGLELRAQNAGGIAYSTFDNLRIRHGKIGIYLQQDETSFINSNSWNHAQISGGGFEYGLFVDGGNNNVLTGLVIEPPSSTHAHLYVRQGEISGVEIRIEGTAQPESIPLILFDRDTKNSTLTGVYAGGLTLDKGNNFINMKSGKAIHYRNSSFNCFQNATFFSPDSISLTNWDITGHQVTYDILPPELLNTHNVLQVRVPAGSTAHVEPSALARPQVGDLPLYDQVNFGYYVKTDQPGIAYAYTNAVLGWTRSTAHSGQGEWEFVGMNAEVDRTTSSRFVLQINNTSGAEAIVYISIPTLSFGNQLPVLEERPIFSSGGQLTGLLSYALASVATPADSYLVLPLKANYFEITNGQTIRRINHLTANRFPKGSAVTLLFNIGNVEVTNGPYLQLKSTYYSVINGSLSLISNGDGTWREVGRNN